MQMWHLSVNSMSNGVSSAVKPDNTGSGMHNDTKTGGVLAYTFGPRTDDTCRELLALLTPFNIGMITRDGWGSYAREVPKEKHLTGKILTQRIEWNNLTLRTRIKRLARRIICFSRSVELHEKVIGAFIEKYMFYSLEALPFLGGCWLFTLSNHSDPPLCIQGHISIPVYINF